MEKVLLSSQTWFYIDSEGHERGPFRADEMLGWFYKNVPFPPDLVVRRSTRSNFSRLSSLALANPVQTNVSLYGEETAQKKDEAKSSEISATQNNEEYIEPETKEECFKSETMAECIKSEIKAESIKIEAKTEIKEEFTKSEIKEEFKDRELEEKYIKPEIKVECLKSEIKKEYIELRHDFNIVERKEEDRKSEQISTKTEKKYIKPETHKESLKCEIKQVREDLLLSIISNQKIVMLKDYNESHKKGEVLTIKGLSCAGHYWRIKNRKNLRVDARGSLYDFCSPTRVPKGVTNYLNAKQAKEREINKLNNTSIQKSFMSVKLPPVAPKVQSPTHSFTQMFPNLSPSPPTLGDQGMANIFEEKEEEEEGGRRVDWRGRKYFRAKRKRTRRERREANKETEREKRKDWARERELERINREKKDQERELSRLKEKERGKRRDHDIAEERSKRDKHREREVARQRDREREREDRDRDREREREKERERRWEKEKDRSSRRPEDRKTASSYFAL